MHGGPVWASVTWPPDRTTLVVSVDDRFPDPVMDFLVDAMRQWERVSSLTFEFTRHTAPPREGVRGVPDDPIDIAIEVAPKPTIDGFVWLNHTETFITSAIIYLNNETLDPEVWVQKGGWKKVAGHEGGHSLGLEHPDEEQLGNELSIMITGFLTDSSGTPITEPQPADIEAVQHYYGPPDDAPAPTPLTTEFSLLFDEGFYLEQNPDVEAAGVDPEQHYIAFGANEGRDPNNLFNTSFYLGANPDVATAGMNPLLHYAEFGWREGRDPSPEFDTDAYLDAYPDVAMANMNPLLHYLIWGVGEGREIFPV